MANPGVVLYRGPSVLDGEPIICVATFNSKNAKTGDMIQTWILREDVSPTVAVALGKDTSICGRCPHRHFSGGACYVLPFQAPTVVFNNYHLGTYDKLDTTTLKRFLGRKIRLGSYGDPAAVPYHVWLGVVGLCNGHTGYTHQLNHECFDMKLTDFCQISVETSAQYRDAVENNLGTFRVIPEGGKLHDGEMMCPNEIYKLQCVACGLCDGRHQHRIAITVHGSKKPRFNHRFGHIHIKNID